VNFSSKLLQDAVDQFASLPGVGRRTAARYVLQLLKRSPQEVENFTRALSQLKNQILHCTKCHNISDTEVCTICSNPRRDNSLICVVEDIRDVMAFENTHQYFGLYHVLGGIISPMDGIGPGDLQIASLMERVKNNEIKEVILALPATMEGDTTNFYLFRKLKDLNIQVSNIVRGISVGSEIEYADEQSLGRSIMHRVPYENSLSKH
jgi:recombination protein RecR